MHMTIRVITYAETKENGHKEAITILEGLCENQYPFDYYQVGDTCNANSETGKNLINKGMEYTWLDFKGHMQSIRELMAVMSDEDIFEERLPHHVAKPKNAMPTIAKHYFYQVGQYTGSPIWLYDPDGGGIRDRGHLKSVLSKWSNRYKGKTNPYKNMKVWVTVSDVHY